MVSTFSFHSLPHCPEHLGQMSPTLLTFQFILRNNKEVILQNISKCHPNIRPTRESKRQQQCIRGLRKEECIASIKTRSTKYLKQTFGIIDYWLMPLSLVSLRCFLALISQAKGSWPKNKRVHLKVFIPVLIRDS